MYYDQKFTQTLLTNRLELPVYSDIFISESLRLAKCRTLELIEMGRSVAKISENRSSDCKLCVYRAIHSRSEGYNELQRKRMENLLEYKR